MRKHKKMPTDRKAKEGHGDTSPVMIGKARMVGVAAPLKHSRIKGRKKSRKGGRS